MGFSKEKGHEIEVVCSAIIRFGKLTEEKWEELTNNRTELKYVIERSFRPEELEEILDYIQQDWKGIFDYATRKERKVKL